MKLKNLWLVLILAAGLGALAGCKKSQPVAETVPAMTIEGVSVDVPKLMQAVTASKSTTTRDDVAKVMMNLRYGQYEKCRVDLEKIMAGPALTDEQKKLAAEVDEQLKQVIAKAGPVRK